MKKIKQLKKGEKFRFNDIIYIVIRKYINDDKPLIGVNNHNEHFFHNEDLEVETVDKL